MAESIWPSVLSGLGSGLEQIGRGYQVGGAAWSPQVLHQIGAENLQASSQRHQSRQLLADRIMASLQQGTISPQSAQSALQKLGYPLDVGNMQSTAYDANQLANQEARFQIGLRGAQGGQMVDWAELGQSGLPQLNLAQPAAASQAALGLPTAPQAPPGAQGVPIGTASYLSARQRYGMPAPATAQPAAEAPEVTGFAPKPIIGRPLPSNEMPQGEGTTIEEGVDPGTGERITVKQYADGSIVRLRGTQADVPAVDIAGTGLGREAPIQVAQAGQAVGASSTGGAPVPPEIASAAAHAQSELKRFIQIGKARKMSPEQIAASVQQFMPAIRAEEEFKANQGQLSAQANAQRIAEEKLYEAYEEGGYLIRKNRKTGEPEIWMKAEKKAPLVSVGDKAGQKLSERMAEKTAEGLIKNYDEKLSGIPSLLDSLDQAEDAWEKALPVLGSGADFKIGASKMLNSLVGSDYNADAIENAELLRTTLGKYVELTLKTVDSAPALAQMQLIQKNAGELSTDPRALLRIIGLMKRQAIERAERHNREVGEVESYMAENSDRMPRNIKIQIRPPKPWEK